MNSCALHYVQVALNEAKFCEEKVKSECQQVQEENTRLKEKVQVNVLTEWVQSGKPSNFSSIVFFSQLLTQAPAGSWGAWSLCWPGQVVFCHFWIFGSVH